MSVCLSGDKDNNHNQRRWSVRALCGTSFCASIHCPLHHHSSSSFSFTAAWLVGHLGLRGIDGWVCNNIDGCVCVMGREGSFVTCTWSLCEEVATGSLPFRNRVSFMSTQFNFHGSKGKAQIFCFCVSAGISAKDSMRTTFLCTTCVLVAVYYYSHFTHAR